MSRQLFQQIVDLERTVDALAKRVAELESAKRGVGVFEAMGVGVTDGPPLPIIKRGPGRPPKVANGD